ncbi:FecR family protein [Echinicola salinicaeni]|uniref:FecR family protein n=1 Tax=Echinicola salinicaeni TaxID=2762757 RepID=UPI001645EC2C|nr:FecR family protein [Echinicola salinicaeni]
MNKNSGNIDFSIIWKKVHTSLTVEEERQLKDWLAASEEHQDYFDKVRAFYKNGSQFENTNVISKEAWPHVFNKVNLSQTKRNNRYFLYAASLAASIVLMIGFLAILKPELFRKEVLLQAESSIVPGTEKAILLMDNGSSYDLSSGKNLSLEEGGAEISSKGNSLKYNSEKVTEKEVKFNTLVIPRGGQFNLTLADGTQVWLNAGSSLKYPTAFMGNDRTVELTGEAFFEVTKNRKKPFKVISGGQIVQVLGTSFNISSYEEDANIYTTLVEGKVNVYLEDEPQQKQVLVPNHQSVLRKGQNAIARRVVDVNEYISWKEGWFYFKDKSLETIVLDLERWYDVSFQFENQKAKKIPFTGKVRRYENLEDVLKLIEKTGDVNFKIERRIVTVQ